MNVIAKLRGLSTAGKIVLGLVLLALAIALLLIGYRYAAGVAGAGILGILGLAATRPRGNPSSLSDSAGELGELNFEQAERDADRAGREVDARARDRAADRAVEAEKRAVAAGADDGDDPRRVYERQTAAGRHRRRD